jgi:hypothetical protein
MVPDMLETSRAAGECDSLESYIVPIICLFRILVCNFRADGLIVVAVTTKAPSRGSPYLNVLLVTEGDKGTCRYSL